ncbi:hypothetical protein BDV59DRAFT_180858 [Aspergillus ambiguus]|uniref:uncharacterized protein n=1 Tax=Aspergillus ambiguus TaxID=176160 RepID=UPI003CCCE5E0
MLRHLDTLYLTHRHDVHNHSYMHGALAYYYPCSTRVYWSFRTIVSISFSTFVFFKTTKYIFHIRSTVIFALRPTYIGSQNKITFG